MAAGAFALEGGAYDEVFVNAQRIRQAVVEDSAAAFAVADVLVVPTAASPAPERDAALRQLRDDPVGVYAHDVLTVGPSLAGLPVVAVPVGEASVQVVGAWGREADCVRAALAIEAAGLS